MSACGHDGWVKGCLECERQEKAAREAMGDLYVGNQDVCGICEEPLDDGRDFIVGLDGAGSHVVCLESAGVWNPNPDEESDRV